MANGRANGTATGVAVGGNLTPIDSVSDQDVHWRSQSPVQYG